MSRLTTDARARLRQQLMATLAPPDRDTRVKLECAAFDAVIADYFTPAGLKRLRAMPAEWFNEVSYAHVTPSGERLCRAIRGAGQPLPCTPPRTHTPGAAAQAAIDRWHAHVEAAAARERTIGHRVDAVLDSCSTLAAVLAKLPDARDILKLPPAADAAASAAELNAALAARTAPAAPAAGKAAKSKPARKR